LPHNTSTAAVDVLTPFTSQEASVYVAHSGEYLRQPLGYPALRADPLGRGRLSQPVCPANARGALSSLGVAA